MKEKTIEKVRADLADWAYIENLPTTWHGFARKAELPPPSDGEDVFLLFCYENPATRRRVTGYFHEETVEYKLKLGYALTEFCFIDCMAATKDEYTALLERWLDRLLGDMEEFRAEHISALVHAKKIMEWEYGAQLPAAQEGYELYIRPAEPVAITNGSYIIIDYECWELDSSVTIYYNIFRDEFFGEAKIRRLPAMNYVFDCATLPELEQKLADNLTGRLREIKAAALAKGA